MPTVLPILQPTPIFQKKDYRDVLRREMDAGKIPLSLGRDCPVKCEFCYELDHSYRETLDPAQNHRRGLEVHPRLHQQEADGPEAILVSRRQ